MSSNLVNGQQLSTFQNLPHSFFKNCMSSMSEKRKRGVIGGDTRDSTKSRRGASGKIKEEPVRDVADDIPSPSTQRLKEDENINSERINDSDTFLSSISDPDTEDEDDSAIYEAGMILEVEMENFMNHRKFTLKLGKVVNFVTGQNGSGKSACVAAIQLCLGATASKTGRAPNMGKMVRHGSPGPAICRVKLLNEGDDAYKPDIYGKFISVERRITRQGGATYNIYGSRVGANSIISHDKLELEKILQNFNIYVDNPCCILTQEQSKTFINGQEKEKYEFFLKATGLERISQEIVESTELVEVGLRAFEASKTTKAEKYAAAQELQTTLNALQALDKHQDEIQECLAMMFWCDVQEAQDIVDEILVKKSTQAKNLTAAEENFVAQEKKKENIGSVDETSALLDEIAKAQQELEDEYHQAVKAYKDKCFLETECKAVVSQLKSNLGTHQQRLADTQQNIADLQAASMKDAAEAVRVVLEKIASCRHSLEQSEAAITLANDQSRNTASELEQVTLSRSQQTRQRDHLQRAITDSNHELAAMQRNGGSGRLNRFHNIMPRVVEEMKNTSFRSAVCGPLGMEILLKDEHKHLGSVVEKSLWHSLTSFVVDNAADRTTLSAILRKNGLQSFSQIYMQSKRPRYNVQLSREVPGTVFICDTIHVESDTVFNALVDQNRIDQVIITQSERESDEKFVTSVGGQKNFFPGIKQALTMDGRSISYRNGNKSSEQSNFPYKKLLAADTSEIIASLESSISRDEADVANMQEDIKNTVEKVSLLEKQRQQDERNVLLHSREVGRYRKVLTELQNEHSDIQTSNSAGQMDFASLEAEANELTDAISEVQTRIDSAISNVNIAKGEMKECLAERRRIETRRKSLKSQQNEQEDIIENHINIIQGLSREVDKAHREVVKNQKVMAEVEKVLSDKQTVVEERTELARIRTPQHKPDWNGEPIELGKKDTRESLNKRINRLRGLIEEGKRRAGLEGFTVAILTERVMKATNDFHKFKQEHSEVKKRIKYMQKDLSEREALWEKQVKHSSKLVSRSFDSYMQKRGFSGSVVFDHTKQLLTVKSQTDNANVATRCTDLRQMSGGERSYTALCLLLALGHVIECPFRLMDEYDVFLDQMARKLTLDILAEYARDKEQRGRQFIIITPQDLRHMTTSDDLRICKMPDPQRIHTNMPQQQTLDFEAA